MRRRKLVLRAETVRTLASPQLSRAVGGMPQPSDEAGPCNPTLSWCDPGTRTAYCDSQFCWPPP